MWLNAFKPKSEHILNDGVPGVPCVPTASGANEYKDPGGIKIRNTEVNQSVPGVPQSNARNTGNTTGKNGLYGRCSSASEHPPGFSACGTSGTHGTPEKQHAPERNAKSAEKSLAFFGSTWCSQILMPVMMLLNCITLIIWHGSSCKAMAWGLMKQSSWQRE